MKRPPARLIARYGIREMMGLAVMGAALFWAAGTLTWWQAWATLGIMLVWILGTAWVVIFKFPALLIERLGPRKGAKLWDTVIMSLLGLLQLARYVIAGLDFRSHWTTGITLSAQLPALLFCALGYALVLWATYSNAYFSQIVRIQREKRQTVASGGPYRFIRHPAYLGAAVFELCSPLLLGSVWAFIPSFFCAALLVLRTALEDRTLQAELPGYLEYTRQVRNRLLPGIW